MMDLSDQNLRKLTEEKWLKRMSANLVEMDNMDRRMLW
jgi:hypothetical protein